MAMIITVRGFQRYNILTPLRSLYSNHFSDFSGQLLLIMSIIMVALRNRTSKTKYINGYDRGQLKSTIIPMRD